MGAETTFSHYIPVEVTVTTTPTSIADLVRTALAAAGKGEEVYYDEVIHGRIHKVKAPAVLLDGTTAKDVFRVGWRLKDYAGTPASITQTIPAAEVWDEGVSAAQPLLSVAAGTATVLLLLFINTSV